MILSVYAKLAIFGVVLHLIVFYSIFDIYYSSPLIQHLNAHPITSLDGPAKRLVVFSADGLRADTFFDNPQKSPFLHSLINNTKASWGISSSHVPTESRPGHVAIFAGFYEDVSAVTRGWKVNPVQFDSVFNRSHEAWAWGSPDIVSMFSDEVAHVHGDVYPAEMEQFFDENAWKLDEWVHDKVEEMFNESSMSASLSERLNANGVMFFLHFLGIDVNGHSSKPYSSDYITNLVFVDNAIRNVSNLMANYFNDNKTAFIFTSDHGMTDWGSHGAGTSEEVLTPYVVWGSGVKASYFSRNINQIDLAPLMSSLLGIPIPTNSIGSLPIQLQESASENNNNSNLESSMLFSLQLLEQFTFKRNEKKSHTLSIFFKEFPDLKPEALRSVEKEIQRLIKLKRFEAASQICIRLFDKVRDGIFYFHRYERTLLGTAIASTFISWIWLIFLFSTRSNVKANDQIAIFTPEPTACAMLSLLALVLVGIGSALFLLTSVFTQRWLLSFALLFMTLSVHLNSDEYNGVNLKFWKRLWSVVCVCLAIFPLLPPVGSTPNSMACIAANMMQARGGAYSSQELKHALLLVLLIETAFFGTGNIASINSFNPSFVRLFIQTFSPFIMTALLLFKIVLPFLSVSFAFVTTLQPAQLTFSRLAYIIFIITDAMAMIFFTQLTDEGSWLEIGTSISHYVISMAISVFVFGFLHLAHILLPFSLRHRDRNKHVI
ncbi:unnamed protein product [Anisakis simplex]|uniref:GPI ethanolamine phosphate transferase 1 n=1 Tax=Anisakis simplex TaxID=6269 RepID=A0A0M3JYS3_ANISI|nr:unnamed protein product [Anisakis simplex]